MKKKYSINMKKVHLIIAAALAILACSCNKEQAIETVQDGEEVNVSFVTEIPELQTRAIGDGTTANRLYVYVYDDNEGAPDANITGLNTDKEIHLSTTVDFKLVKGKTYHFIFWAAKNGNSYYSVDVANKTIGIDYNGVANNEERDAFYAVKTLKVQGPLTETIKLYRPFSQVNFGTETADYNDAKNAGLEVIKSGFFATEAAKTLDVFAGEGKDAVEITYAVANLPEEDLVLLDGTHYKYMAMNYFVPVGKLSERHLSNVKGVFTSTKGEEFEIAVPSAPVQANWRTNIIGRLLTDQVVFNIEIVPAFDGDININEVSNITSLKSIFENGGSAVLTEDLVLDQTISVPAGKEVTLNLNGKTISNTNGIWDQPTAADNNWSLLSVKGGTLTIKGAGLLKAKENDCYAVDVQDGGKVIIEDGEFVGNIHAVYVNKGEAEIRGGKFSIVQTYPQADKAYEFVLNCLDANRAAGTAKITVYGGEFVNFNPANCWAEGANTNFVAAGYKSEKISEDPLIYKVSAE